eukprot:2411298-Amphidinium_carterae.1
MSRKAHTTFVMSALAPMMSSQHHFCMSSKSARLTTQHGRRCYAAQTAEPSLGITQCHNMQPGATL